MTIADQLTVASLLEAAREETGLADLGEDSWQEGLDRLLHSLHTEADLNEIGVQVVATMLRDHLKSRLWVTDWHGRHPEIGTAVVPDPVVILGQPRTGTTILFDLLAQDGRFRVPLTWEVASPHPPPETTTYDTDPRIEAVFARTRPLTPPASRLCAGRRTTVRSCRRSVDRRPVWGRGTSGAPSMPRSS